MAVYTSVNQSELEDFLEQYNLGKLISYDGILEGIENSNYKILMEEGDFILTIFEKRVKSSDLPFFIKTHCDNLNSKDAISSEIPLDEEVYPTKVIAEGKIKQGTIDCKIYSNYGPISINTN